jgi:hypothetical protein
MFRGKTNALEFLGLPADAKYENAKRAYKKMALRLHPNKPGGSHEEFQRLGAALEMIERMMHGASKWQPEKGPSHRNNPPRPPPPPKYPTVNVVLSGRENDPLEGAIKQFVFATDPTLEMLMRRVQQETPRIAEFLKDGFRAYDAFSFEHGGKIETVIENMKDFIHGFVGAGLNDVTASVRLEARKPGQHRDGWMFFGETNDARRRRTETEAEKRRKQKEKARARADATAGPTIDVTVKIWTVSNGASIGTKTLRFERPPTIRKVVDRVYAEISPEEIRKMFRKGYLAFPETGGRAWTSMNVPIRDLKIQAPPKFNILLRDDKKTHDLKWMKKTETEAEMWARMARK